MNKNLDTVERERERESYSLLNEEIYYSKINLLFKQIGYIYYVNRIEKNIIKQEKIEMVGLESKKC